MNCPYCNHNDTQVLESRLLFEGLGVRRRRECKKCTKRFTTHELVVNLELKVVKKNGSVEDYKREKLAKGVRKACWKREVLEEKMEELLDDIELKLLNRRTIQIKSTDIGKMVLARLKKLDDVAYLRFASVYMDFEKASDFSKVLDNLK
jgi:transcriptional repressor NrdR